MYVSRIIVDKKKRNEKKFPLSGRKREKRIKMFSLVSSVRDRERERKRIKISQKNVGRMERFVG